MNKTVLVLAIFAFCLPLSVLSSDLKENDNRELVSINLGGLLGGLLANYTNTSTANTTAPAANNTSSANNTAPAANNTSSANNTTPVANNTSSANNTAPAANNTSSANSTAPASNSTSSNNTSSAPANNTNSTNSTQPADSDSESDSDPASPTNSTNATNSTNTTVTPAPIKYYKNDVNMATFKDDCIRVHNDYRNQVNLSNLTWSDSLAASAQAWANNMAANGFRHSGKTGENIASTSYTTSVLGRLLGLWVHEKSHFIVGCKYPACSSTSDEVGHYTQIVWHSTTQVGCGFAPGANRGYNYLCCQYYKAGNVVGQYVY